MRIRAVIFDMDGLMFDTEDLVRRAWDFAGGRLGYEHFGDNIFNTLGKGDVYKRQNYSTVIRRYLYGFSRKRGDCLRFGDAVPAPEVS